MNKQLNKPTFLVIGAGKSGTTSLFQYLKQHPQIYMSPIKATNFFAFEGTKPAFRGPGDRHRVGAPCLDLDSYYQMFQEVNNQVALGEVSPLYMYAPQASERIYKYLPEVKVIAILRDPADAAYSYYRMLLRLKYESLTDFAQALQAESKRIQQNWSPAWHYVQRGYYYTQLKPYFEKFKREQIRVYRYEELKNNSIGLMQDLYNFIGVSSSFVPNVTFRHNASTKFSRNQQKLLSFSELPRIIISVVPSFSPPNNQNETTSIEIEKEREKLVNSKLSPEIRQQLIQIYREDIEQLQDLIEQDLSKWLQ